MEQAKFDEQLIAALRKPSQWCIIDSVGEGQFLSHKKTGIAVGPPPFSWVHSRDGTLLTHVPPSENSTIHTCCKKVVALEAEARRKESLQRKDRYLKQFGGFN